VQRAQVSIKALAKKRTKKATYNLNTHHNSVVADDCFERRDRSVDVMAATDQAIAILTSENKQLGGVLKPQSELCG
jgi:hypothetical protein